MFENNPFSHPTPTPSPTGNLFGGDTASEDALRLDELLEEAEDAISFGDFEDDRLTEGALGFLRKITETVPRTLWRKNPRFYMAKLMTDLRVRNDEELAAKLDAVRENPDFLRACEYAQISDPALAARLEAIFSADEKKKDEFARL